MGAQRAGDIGHFLLGSAKVTSFPKRVILLSGEPVLVDHLLASRNGGFVVEERSWPGSFAVEDGHLVRSRSGPGGQWAKGAEDERVDRVRQIAEAVELRLSLPFQPVLVLTDGPTAFAAPVSVRGVTVMHQDHFAAWLNSLPDSTDQAGLAILAARIERAFHRSGESRRTPSWQRDRRAATPQGQPPIRPAAGPRDWTPHVGTSTTEYTDPCAAETRRGAPAARIAPRYDSAAPTGWRRLGALLVAAVLALGVLTVVDDGRRLTTAWDGVMAWATTVNRPDTPDAAGDTGAVAAAQAPPPPVAPPPVSQPVALSSCHVLTAAAVTQLLGQTVYLLPSDDPLACHFGPVAGDASVMWLSVALGPGSENRTLSGVNGTHSWSPSIGFSPTGAGGRTIATQVTVAMDAALYPAGSPGPAQLFQAVMSELVTGHEPPATEV